MCLRVGDEVPGADRDVADFIVENALENPGPREIALFAHPGEPCVATTCGR